MDTIEKPLKLQDTDLTFFTNEPGQTLLDRFRTTLADTQLFDVLVGYFRSSGFYQLYEAIEKVEKTRIIVGLGIDETSYRTINEYQNQATIDFESHSEAKKDFQQNFIHEIENSNEDDKRLEIGVRKFIELLLSNCLDDKKDKRNGGNGKKLEIKAYPSKNLHAKVYIGRYHEHDRDHGFVVTGSSNFSYPGLVANREFNVQLKDRRDVEYALAQFEELWKVSVDISEEFVDAVKNKTWLNDTIRPYELYLKLIYEYLEEDINLEERFDSFLPDGFMRLDYQAQAVRQALKKLEEYNGVFLADVVGLGKTFIAAQLLQQLRGKILVICPPVLTEYWEQSLMDFRVPAKVESLGKLERIIKKGADRWDYIVVDEAHRFRNEGTQGYADLLDICRGKKVILVTATPLNNTIDDIYAQLKLFQAPKNSAIPGIINLENFFNQLKKKLRKYEKHEPEYQEMMRDVSSEIRERILKHVMVRRTRHDVVTYFQNDIQQQGLTFPEVKDPQKIVYQYEGETEEVFNQTIALLAQFRYARYIPLLYYTGSKSLTEFEKQQQRNVGGFMKSILVKRLESSFYAFKQSIGRFIRSYERFISMLDTGTVYISKKVDVYELLDNDDIEKLEKAVEEERAHRYSAKDFKADFITDLNYDLETLRAVHALWGKVQTDPKLEKFVGELRQHPILKKQRLVVFTESKETGNYLYENLVRRYPIQTMFYSSEGGRLANEPRLLKHTIARDTILENFDPGAKNPANDLRILITTDVLAEGINLHRSNVLINYDLPWNPTRVLQRAGRVNRLGTPHSEVHIFNFFPASHSDEHLGLELNITNKLQLFHDILGEDAKYLSDGEEVSSQVLFESLNSKRAYTGEGEEEGDSELKYLEMIRTIRDEDPDLFERIKNLPKKARSGRKDPGSLSTQLITFFRLGKLKKFYQNTSGTAQEITFFDAVEQLVCYPDTRRTTIPLEEYFQLLSTNKARFELDTTQDNDMTTTRGGTSNVKYIEKRLKEPSFRRYKGFTDLDEEFIKGVKQMIQQGLMAKKTAQKIKKELEREADPLAMLDILRKHIRSIITEETQHSKSAVPREVILSSYLTT